MSLLFCIRVFHWVGVWPKTKDKYGQIYNTYTLFIISTLLFTIISEIIELCMSWGDLPRTTINSCVMLLIMSSIGKVVLLWIKKDKLLLLIDELQTNDLFTFGNGEGYPNSVLNNSLKHAKLVTVLYFGMGCITIPVWNLMPTMQYWFSKEHIPDAEINIGMPYQRPLPIIAWYPFDHSSTPVYELIYTYQFVCGCIYSFIILASDTMAFIFIIHICARFDILKYYVVSASDRLVTITNSNDHSLFIPLPKASLKTKNSTLENEHAIISDDNLKVKKIDFTISGKKLRMKKLLKAERNIGFTSNLKDNSEDEGGKRMGHVSDVSKNVLEHNEISSIVEMPIISCIEMHQAILRNVEVLESILSHMLMLQFFMSMVIICLSGFQVTLTIGDGSTFSKFAVYFITALFQIFLYCWYGDLLLSKSSGIQEAAYNSAWPEGSRRFKQSIGFIILRAQRPACVTVGKFRVVSLETFVSLLNVSYSMFVVLRQIYDRNEN